MPRLPYRKTFHLLAGLLLATSLGGAAAVFAAPVQAFDLQEDLLDVVRVHNATELMAAMGSNRRILLAPGKYEISAALAGDNPVFQREGQLLYIDGVENLSIEGAGADRTQIVIADTFSAVLNFRNSRNLQISGIEMGHVPQSHAICLGAVLFFENSSQIRLNQLSLFGSGAFGIWAEHTDHLRMRESVIKQCSQGLLFLSDAHHFSFEQSVFIDTVGGVNLADGSHDVHFADSVFRNNASRAGMAYVPYLFGNFDGGSFDSLSVSNCVITGNRFKSLASTQDGLNTSGNRVEGNSW